MNFLWILIGLVIFAIEMRFVARVFDWDGTHHLSKEKRRNGVFYSCFTDRWFRVNGR